MIFFIAIKLLSKRLLQKCLCMLSIFYDFRKNQPKLEPALAKIQFVHLYFQSNICNTASKKEKLPQNFLQLEARIDHHFQLLKLQMSTTKFHIHSVKTSYEWKFGCCWVCVFSAFVFVVPTNPTEWWVFFLSSRLRPVTFQKSEAHDKTFILYH